MKLTVCAEMFFTDLPFTERFAKIREAGYDAAEFWGYQNKDLAAVKQAADEAGITITSFCASGIDPGLNEDGQHEQIADQVAQAIEAAQQIDCKTLIVMSGNVLPKKTRCEQAKSIIGGLKRLAPMAQKAEVTLVLEFLNSKYDHPNYFLDNSEEMSGILRAVHHPYIMALYDIYHAGIMEGNVIEKIRSNIDIIGHFHLAGIPGRHEPKDGEQNYPAIGRAIDALGYEGYVGLEYSPTKDPLESLVETRKWIMGED